MRCFGPNYGATCGRNGAGSEVAVPVQVQISGIYVFETIATNSLGQRERNNLELSASLIIDMSNAVQPAIYAPIVANNAR